MPMSNPVPWPVRNSEQIVRINVDEYIQMPQSGALREGSPIELLDGVLVWKDRRDHEGSFMVVGIRRTNTVERLYRLLDRATEGHGGFVRSQQPVRLSDFSVPEPDVMILRGDHENFCRSASDGDRRLARGRSRGQLAQAGSNRQAQQVRCGRNPRVLDCQSG
jgi:hypothetical protein